MGFYETKSSQDCQRKQEAPLGRLTPPPQARKRLAERVIPSKGRSTGFGSLRPLSGGARSQVPWGPRAAFLRGLRRPLLKGAEVQLGTRTKRPDPPRRKERASPRKQLRALSSACFFLCSTVLLPRQTKTYVLIPSVFGLRRRLSLLCQKLGEEASRAASSWTCRLMATLSALPVLSQDRLAWPH